MGYNRKIGAPSFTDATPRCRTVAEVWAVATPQRFQSYDGDSNSMVDHYYDKLLHLDRCASGNCYVEEKLKAQLQVMVDFVLAFGETGDIDVAALEVLKARH